jgi:hypothetical protein
MPFPTASQSKFAQPDWKEHFAQFDHTSWEARGQASAAEVLRARDTRDVISPSERLRAFADTLPSVRSKLAAPVQTLVEPARAERLDPEPAPVDTKPAASVFTLAKYADDPAPYRRSIRVTRHDPYISDIPVPPDTLDDDEPGRTATDVFHSMAKEAVRVAADPAAKQDEARARSDGTKKADKSEGVAESWADKEVAAARLTREGVEVTRPDGHTRAYKSVREAFVDCHLPLVKHIRFRGRLKEMRELAFKNDNGASYLFKLVPRARLNRRK